MPRYMPGRARPIQYAATATANPMAATSAISGVGAIAVGVKQTAGKRHRETEDDALRGHKVTLRGRPETGRNHARQELHGAEMGRRKRQRVQALQRRQEDQRRVERHDAPAHRCAAGPDHHERQGGDQFAQKTGRRKQ